MQTECRKGQAVVRCGNAQQAGRNIRVTKLAQSLGKCWPPEPRALGAGSRGQEGSGRERRASAQHWQLEAAPARLRGCKRMRRATAATDLLLRSSARGLAIPQVRPKLSGRRRTPREEGNHRHPRDRQAVVSEVRTRVRTEAQAAPGSFGRYLVPG